MEEARTNKRIWELDFIRGGAIIIIIFLHFCLTIRTFTISEVFHQSNTIMFLSKIFNIYHTTPIKYLSEFGLFLLFLVSGISSTLSNDPVKRFIKLFIASVIVTTISIFYNIFSGKNYLIICGAIHVYMLCSLIYLALKKCPLKIIIIFTFFSFILWFVFKFMIAINDYPQSFILFILGLPSSYPSGYGEHFFIHNYLLYYMIGIILGKTIYKKRQSIFPKLESNVTKKIQKLGLKSGLLYLAHFIIIPVISYLICLLLSHF